MTISSTTRVAGPFVGDDAVVNLDFTFKVFDDSEVQILSRLDSTGVDTELVLGADYTVALNADQDTAPGGRVTLSGPLATGRTAFIVSEVSPLQESVFTNTGGFYPSVLNDALDRLHALHLENREVNSRAVVTPVGETGNIALPPVDNRIGKYLYFDVNGDLVASDGTDAGTAIAAVVALLASTASGEGASLVKLKNGFNLQNILNYATTGAKGLTFTLPTGSSGNGFTLQVIKHSSPLNYSASTRASFVTQHEDAQNLALNDIIPGSVFDFTYSGQGWVDAANNLSQSTSMGLFVATTKTGDSSAHCFTGIGQLGAIGSGSIGTGTGGYNELGGFQAQLTNIGSTHGNISGYEVLTADGTSGTNFDTAIKNVIARVARYNAGSRPVHCFMASSEGNKPVDSILTVNTSAYNQFKAGIDLSSTTFTTGFAALFPNNTGISFKGNDGTNRIVLGSSNLGVSYLRPSDTAAYVEIQSTTGTTLLRSENLSDSLSIYVNGSLKKITQGAANSGGAGFALLRVTN